MEPGSWLAHVDILWYRPPSSWGHEQATTGKILHDSLLELPPPPFTPLKSVEHFEQQRKLQELALKLCKTEWAAQWSAGHWLGDYTFEQTTKICFHQVHNYYYRRKLKIWRIWRKLTATKMFKKELMTVSCHPSRMQQTGMDELPTELAAPQDTVKWSPPARRG